MALSTRPMTLSMTTCCATASDIKESTATENCYGSVFGNHTAPTPSELLEAGLHGCCIGAHATAGDHSPGRKKSTSLHDASLYDDVAV